MRILGVMTGTSCDGLDAVCVEFMGAGTGAQWRILWSESIDYPKALRAKILQLQLPGRKISIRDFLTLDGDLGNWYGKSLKAFMDRHEPKPDVIANHGQTVAHFPDIHSTLQLGDPTRVSSMTGLTVISHFREGDLSAGGQGAPLMPLFHSMLAKRLPAGSGGVAIHNLGGISNLTYLHPQDSGLALAFDTGPSGIWIDEAVTLMTRGKKKFDTNGSVARQGNPDMKAVKKVLAHPYFRKSPPKSTGRDDFPFSFLKSKTRARGADLVATATAITVESIAAAYETHILKKGLPLHAIYCAGGGAKNSYLLELLQLRLPALAVKKLSDAGIANLDEQVLEALGFAMFGHLSLGGKPLGGNWTGAKSFGAPGWITPGQNWRSVVSGLAGL